MAAAGRKELSMESFIHCMLCCAPVEHPQLLGNCQHVFCRKCWLDVRKLTFSATNLGYNSCDPSFGSVDPLVELLCPTCSSVTSCDEVKPGLPPQHMVTSCLDYLKLSPSNTVSKECQLCHSNDCQAKAERFCADCFQDVCFNCACKHAGMQHTIWALPQNFELRCKAHDCRVTSMCRPCKKMLCEQCLAMNHSKPGRRPHNIVTVADILDHKGARMGENMNDLQKEVKERRNLCQRLEELRTQQEEQLYKASADIDRQAELMVKEIERQKCRLKEALLRRHDQVTQALEHQMKYTQHGISAIHKLTALMLLLTKQGQEFSLLANYDELRLRSYNLCERKAGSLHDSSLKPVQTALVFKPKTTLTLGELVPHVMPLTTMKMETPVFFSNAQEPEPKPIWKSVLSRKDMSTRTKAKGVTFLPDGKVAAAFHSANQIRCFNTQGDLCVSISSPTKDIVKPNGVVYGGENSIIVTDSYKRQVVIFKTPTGNHSKKLVQQDPTKGLHPPNIFTDPSGIAMDFNLARIIVTDTANHNVTIISTNSRMMKQFGCHGNKDSEFDCPEFVAVDHKHNILVSDCNNHCIKVFDSEGKFLSKFGCYGNRLHQLSHPGGIAVDNHGNILVADGGNNRVKLYSADGEKCKVILTLDEHDIFWPYGLAVNSSGLVALTRKADSTIAVFNYLKSDNPTS